MPRRTDTRPIKPAASAKRHGQVPGLSLLPVERPPVERPVKRSFRIAGHLTSISLESIFWDALKDAAIKRGMTQANLVAQIDAARGATNLSSAVRVWLFDDLQRRSAGPAPPGCAG